MKLKLITPPAIEPVTVDEIKAHCRVDGTADNLYLSGLVKAARQHIETLCGPLISQTWEQYEDAWPAGVISLGKPRVSAITSIKYTDTDAVEATFAASAYVLDTADECSGRIVLKSGSSWPSTLLTEINPIAIRFVCGYGAASSSIPEPVRIAIMLLTAHWFENREPINIGNVVNAIPFTVDALLANYRYWR